MANVSFKRGTQSALEQLNGSYVVGSFYLTSDTNRFYYASATNKLEDLNQYIHFVDVQTNPSTGKTALPTSSSATLKEGDIYYIKDENIFCIYTNGSWKQINPDTTLASGQTAVFGVQAEGQNGAVVAIDIADSNEAHTVHATGDFSIVGGDNVTVSVTNNVITIDTPDDENTTYSLETTYQPTKGQIKLKSSAANDDSTIDITGAGNVSVTSTTDGGILIRGGSDVTSIIDGFDASGVYSIELGGVSLSTNGVAPTISYGSANAEKKTAVFIQGATGNPTAELDVYTKKEVDDLFTSEKASLDAMHYAGVISTTADVTNKLSSSTAAHGVGTTYKAGMAFTLGSAQVNIGDLIIANGTDNNITWEVVPAGDNQMLSISGNTATSQVTFHDGVSEADLGTISIEGGRKDSDTNNAAIEVTADTDNNGKDTYFTVVHGAAGAGTSITFTAASGNAIQAYNTSLNIPIITGLSKDNNGHITSITAQYYTLKDTHAVLTSSTSILAVSTTDNAATFSQSLQLDQATPVDISFRVVSDNLKISDASGDIKINLAWEEF